MLIMAQWPGINHVKCFLYHIDFALFKTPLFIVTIFLVISWGAQSTFIHLGWFWNLLSMHGSGKCYVNKVLFFAIFTCNL